MTEETPLQVFQVEINRIIQETQTTGRTETGKIQLQVFPAKTDKIIQETQTTGETITVRIEIDATQQAVSQAEIEIKTTEITTRITEEMSTGSKIKTEETLPASSQARTTRDSNPIRDLITEIKTQTGISDIKTKIVNLRIKDLQVKTTTITTIIAKKTKKVKL